MNSLSYAVDTETPPINFGGGLNLKQSVNDIADNESPDMSNMIDDQYGASFKRNGSQRYIIQAVSSFPVTSLYRAYASSGSTYMKQTLMTNRDRIYMSSNDVNGFWITLASGLSTNQHWTFTQMNNKVIMNGDKLVDNTKIYDLTTSSLTDLMHNDGSTYTAVIRAKYAINSKNYLIEANCVDYTQSVSTAYPSRIYYSLLLQPSSMTQTRFIDIKRDDGEQITGISELNGVVDIWKETSIAELAFNTLDNIANGGDQTVTQRVYGFGLYAPRTLANLGDGYIFGAKDGLRWWDGGKKTRLQLEAESRPISTNIQPIIDKIIKAGTYINAVGIYYPKRSWYVFSYEDPDKSPRGVNNSVLVYDLINATWYPFNNWLVESMATMDGIGDTGQFMYGDSDDGYVYLADQDNFPNDARKEIILDTMDSSDTWARSSQNTQNVLEGTASLKIGLSNTVFFSSITNMKVYNVGEWHDKSQITKDDKLSFKVFVGTISNLVNLRVDLELNDVPNDFDTTFTSITFSSQSLALAMSSTSLTGSNTNWAYVEVALSSFPIEDSWVNLSTETAPFANTFTYYGLRFVASATAGCNLSIDDVRIVEATENPLNAYRFTKQYNFGTQANKRLRQVVLNREISSDGTLYIDEYGNFGEQSRRIPFNGGFNKEIWVADFGATTSIVGLNSIDFSVLDSTYFGNFNAADIRHLVADQNNIWGYDFTNDRIIKFTKSSMTGTNFSTYGSFGLGNGTTYFSNGLQMAVDDKYLYMVDNNNNRVQVHDKNTLQPIKIFGSLGLGTTSFHNLTGLAVDDRYLYVGDDGNYSIKKIDKSTGGYVSSVKLNLNEIGETTLSVDDKYVYDAYNSISQDNVFMQDVILEKRDKQDLHLVKRVIVRPKSGVSIYGTSISSYALLGDISISDDYLYIPFTDDVSGNINKNPDEIGFGTGYYYLQKLNKSDFSIVREYKSNNSMFSVAANGISYIPKRRDEVENMLQESNYFQLRYSENDLDNNMKLYTQTFLFIPEELRETK